MGQKSKALEMLTSFHGSTSRRIQTKGEQILFQNQETLSQVMRRELPISVKRVT
jgi:hypothetical protein